MKRLTEWFNGPFQWWVKRMLLKLPGLPSVQDACGHIWCLREWNYQYRCPEHQNDP